MFIIFVRLRRSQQLGPDAMALHAAARITGEAPPLFFFFVAENSRVLPHRFTALTCRVS